MGITHHPTKILYMIVGVLYFPVGTLLAWHAYQDVIGLEKRCQYDKAERKIENDGIIIFGLVAAWLVVFIIWCNSGQEIQ